MGKGCCVGKVASTTDSSTTSEAPPFDNARQREQGWEVLVTTDTYTPSRKPGLSGYRADQTDDNEARQGTGLAHFNSWQELTCAAPRLRRMKIIAQTRDKAKSARAPSQAIGRKRSDDHVSTSSSAELPCTFSTSRPGHVKKA